MRKLVLLMLVLASGGARAQNVLVRECVVPYIGVYSDTLRPGKKICTRPNAVHSGFELVINDRDYPEEELEQIDPRLVESVHVIKSRMYYTWNSPTRDILWITLRKPADSVDTPAVNKKGIFLKNRPQRKIVVRDEETGEVISGATIQMAGRSLATNGNGEVIVQTVQEQRSQIEISHVGYESLLLKPGAFRGIDEIILTMKRKPLEMEPVVVVGYQTIRCVRMIACTLTKVADGEMLSVDRVAPEVTTVKTKTPGREGFSVFPNPVVRDHVVTLDVRNTGINEGIVQLVSMGGQVVKTERIQIGKAHTFPFRIPSIASGVYFIRMYNAGNHQQWVSRVVVH